MKKYITTLLIIFQSLNFSTHAQEGPDYTQYFLGLARNHPGLTGIDPFINVTLGYKQAWRGFSENTSRTYGSIFGQIRKGAQLDGGKQSFRISSPEIYDKLKHTKSVRRKHGVGLSLNSVKLGFFRNIDIKTYYAYHLPVTRRYNLSLGTALGIAQQRVDYSDLHVRDEINDDFYQRLINESAGNQSLLIIDFGLAFYSDNIYLSASGKSLINEKISGEEYITDYFNETIINLMAGTKISLNDKYEIHPNISLRYSEMYALGYQGSLRIKYKNYIYAGGGIQDAFRFSFLFGINLINDIYLHYSYDRYNKDVQRFSKGNHEFTIGINLFNSFSSNPYTW